MRTLIILAALVVALPAQAQSNCYQVGNSVYCDQTFTPAQRGSSYGGFNDPSYSTRGSQTFGSDGSVWSQRGRTLYGNDGSTYSRRGNTVYGSDGSSCSLRGQTWYCN